MRLLHTSDLHVGDDATVDRHCCGWTPCVCPVLDVVSMARQSRVDVLLVCGDLFDHSRVDDSVVEHVFGVLASAGVQCVVLPGNHDPMDEKSVYRRVVDRPGVHVVRCAGVVRPLGPALTVWGRPVVIHSPDYHPLADVPPRPIDTEWYVVVAHGHHVAGPSMGRSSPILSSELDQIDADYVALGHWHHATRIADRPPAWYSGWPRPAGPVGGALLVDLTPGRGPTVRELSLPTIGGSDASTD